MKLDGMMINSHFGRKYMENQSGRGGSFMVS